ncbi:MAG: hypothetical protein JF593_01155 [Novosphingobium sp.]|nr:hypothetical protein [Novosphingobium sp.]
MRIEPEAVEAMRARSAIPRARRPWLPLLNAVLSLGEGRAELLRHSERAWASVTFSGSRHSIALAFSGAEAVAAGERFIAVLPEHEFAISRQLVADAAVTAVTHELLPEPRLTVEVEMLLLEEG